MSRTHTPSRIASLLPSATEICFALGLGERVVGVSHECDFPAAAAGLPRLTSARLDAAASSRDINARVAQLVSDGLSIYDIDTAAMRALEPELIVTQDTCEVCAVSFEDVQRAARELLGTDAHIVSLSPLSFDDVMGDIGRVATAAGVADRAPEVVGALRARLEVVRGRAASLPRKRVLALEWIDPPMVAGHWTPELIRTAGGDAVLGHDGAPTRAVAWETVAAEPVDVLLVIPCGFRVEQTLPELPALLSRVGAPRVVVADGNAYFNRPGPRLVDSAELAFDAIHGTDAYAFGPDTLRVI